ncbi:hypothetical protein [Bradyrhizobium liaoningense]|uniref:hypothetical protein n=1 Tax=Bradyrhizobium liaoningense TaxID=43992 RepID=UPI001BA97DEA|nr:hypothetical protein [Bradyrhizobium liaoningense]MBR1069954.1 hypothetical protein [Bradyrhizobium liaoningense]
MTGCSAALEKHIGIAGSDKHDIIGIIAKAAPNLYLPRRTEALDERHALKRIDAAALA